MSKFISVSIAREMSHSKQSSVSQRVSRPSKENGQGPSQNFKIKNAYPISVDGQRPNALNAKNAPHQQQSQKGQTETCVLGRIRISARIDETK